jgi:hypothetical protein
MLEKENSDEIIEQIKKFVSAIPINKYETVIGYEYSSNEQAAKINRDYPDFWYWKEIKVNFEAIFKYCSRNLKVIVEDGFPHTVLIAGGDVESGSILLYSRAKKK